ncbi:hypothetical protein BELL_0358g00020 [Botrytis elliptica]|uniref:Uncharacterized protein n=1 Tax=Botrytis elliptica TaxID=278938 RepID=A0A4Z1JPH3_9HELO|nr:hypothetical protein BELL_0358g00020 [Botrytis elliptica]
MSLIPSSKHKSKRGSSDHNKSSSASEAGSVKLLTTYPEFDQLVKDLKHFDLSLDSEYNHGNKGLKAHESNFREAIIDLQKASKALADKLEEIKASNGPVRLVEEGCGFFLVSMAVYPG